MKKIYCVICGKYRKFENSKISYFLEKTLVLSIVLQYVQEWRWINIQGRWFIWDIQNSLFN